MSTGDLGGEHSLLVNARDKGPVILTGCAHLGIINTVNVHSRSAVSPKSKLS